MWEHSSHVQISPVWLTLLKYHPCQKYAHTHHLYWDKVFSYIPLFPFSRHSEPQSWGLPSHRVSHFGMTGLQHHWVTAPTLLLLSISGSALSTWSPPMHHDSFCYIKSYFVHWNVTTKVSCAIFRHHNELSPILCCHDMFGLVENHMLYLKVVFSVRLLCLVTTRGM